jgi:hypothetical protein
MKSVLPNPTSISALITVGAGAGADVTGLLARGTRVFFGAGAGAREAAAAGTGDFEVFELFMVFYDGGARRAQQSNCRAKSQGAASGRRLKAGDGSRAG